MGGHDFCSENFTEEQTHALQVCTLVASLLSVIGSSFMLENFFLYDKGRYPLTKLVAWLAFGDYVTAVNNIVKTLILLRYPDLYSWEVCVIMRSWFQIAAGSTWCYTSVIAFFLYRFMSTRNTAWVSWPIWISFHVASWGVPAAGVIIMISGDFIYRSPNTGLCYPTEPWHIILWFIPIIVSFVWMLFCYLAIFWKVMRSRNAKIDTQLTINGVDGSVALDTVPSDADAEALLSKHEDKRAQLRRVVLRFSFYILVFFICWFFDVITYFILFFRDNCNVYSFVFGYTLFRNLQGLLDCLVYGLTNLKIRKRFTHSILSAIVSTWELLLAPVLVLPAFIAYTRRVLEPYLSSENYHPPMSDKIFLSINDELMKESKRRPHRKVPAHYFAPAAPSDMDNYSESRAGELQEERAKRREQRLQRKEERRRAEGKEDGGDKVGAEQEAGLRQTRQKKNKKRGQGRRPIPSYYFSETPPDQILLPTDVTRHGDEQAEDLESQRSERSESRPPAEQSDERP